MISPLAYIHPEAVIGENCEIGPFCYIDKNVVIGNNNKLMNGVTLLYGTRMGNNNTVFPGAVIGAVPQDLKFQGEETTAEIGDNNTIRENVTINRGTAAKGKTVVGNNNLLMEGMHAGHDVIINNYCIIGNQTKLAGEVIVDDCAIVSSTTLVHQFCRIGGYARTSTPVRIPRDGETLMHPEMQGLFPAGEGAGYAGGIVSAALDGERVADAVGAYIKK